MQTINELCLAWYVFVNSNYDILIMTITLLVVAGLMLEVIRLNRRMNRLNADMYHHVGELISLLQKDQVQVNINTAKDIAELEKLNLDHHLTAQKEENQFLRKRLAVLEKCMEVISNAQISKRSKKNLRKVLNK